MEIKRDLNPRSYSEQLIDQVEVINHILADGNDDLKIIKESKTLLTITSLMTQTVYNFPFFDCVDSIHLIDKKKLMNSASGTYIRILKPLNCQIETNKNEFTFERALMYANPKYTDTSLISNIYAYDVNSAYLSVLANGWFPDLTQKRECEIVKDGEIGFFESSIGECPILSVKLPGEYADHIFPLKYYPKTAEWGKKQGQVLADLKKRGNKTERDFKKQIINAAIGIVRNHNIWIYTFIVGMCRRRVEQYIDENTIIANTDGIISIGPIEGLDIGSELGQFSIEYENVQLRAKNMNYIIYDQEDVVKQKLRGVAAEERENYSFETGAVKRASHYFDHSLYQVRRTDE